ncbi:MAG: sigma-70 family RNA polymerase sigma factor [Deltaproteobacteria bacterium]|nr:sigma-70 family RNA polymerase sigma factor [Deltaproteobacteria bacterium]
MSDQELVSAAQAGDRRSLEVLWARHAPRVGRFAMRMCRSATEAEDVVQDTLMAATRTLPGFRGQAQVSTWLYQIARSFCIKKRRRTRSVIHADASFDTDESAEVRGLATDDAGVDQRLDQAQLAQAVEEAMTHLSPMYREVLLLRDVEGLTAPEVADVLGLRIDAVKSRLHRARLAVREELAPTLESPAPTAGSDACPDVLSMYSRHLEGDISPDVCSRMEQHLAACPRCQGRCDSLRRTLALCKSSPGPAVPVATQFLVRRALSRALGTSDAGGDGPA